MDETKLSKLKKDVSQIEYKIQYSWDDVDKTKPSSSHTIYKTFVLKTTPRKEYSWDYVKNTTIVTEHPSIFIEGNVILLKITKNHKNNTVSYDIVDSTTLKEIYGFLRDRSIAESYVYIDKKW